MSTLVDLITAGVESVKLVHKQFSAGGPGSGRHEGGGKPKWQPDSDNHETLDKMHSKLVDKGFKFQHSATAKKGEGAISHTYKDPGGYRAVIQERASGNHAIMQSKNGM